MQRIWSLLAVLLLSACGGGGGGGSPPPPPPPPPPEPTAVEAFTQSVQGLTLDNFYFEAVKGLTTRFPETVVAQGLDDLFPLELTQLNNLSLDYMSDTFEMHRIALNVLQSYDRASLSPTQQLDYDIFEWYLQDQIESEQYLNFEFPATYGNFGIPQSTQLFFTDLHPLENLEDVQAYVNRLTVIDNKFAQLESWLIRQRDAGIVESSITMQIAINQVAQIASMAADDLPYYTSFRDKLDNVSGISNAQRAQFREIALSAMFNDVLPAYNRLLGTMRSLESQAPSDVGVGQYPGGNEFYDYILRHHTTSGLTAAEIHQLGLDELTRIHAEMRVLFDQLGYPQNETLAELYNRVANDGGIVAASDALTTFQNLVAFAESNLGDAFDIVPATPVVVLPHPFGGFYVRPSLDGSRPGAFYAGTENDQPYAPMPSLTFHESLPGHHMQLAIAMEQNLPAPRLIARSTGFIEGWALYAERLAWELGWYQNDIYGDLGRLQFEALRAARLVIDTGIHSQGWGFDQAAQFNVDNVGWTLSQSQGAVARYSVFPGQATAYMVGMLQILAERQRAMDALGASFDLKAFHRALLTSGGVPLTLLPSVVDRYIAEAQGTP